MVTVRRSSSKGELEDHAAHSPEALTANTERIESLTQMRCAGVDRSAAIGRGCPSRPKNVNPLWRTTAQSTKSQRALTVDMHLLAALGIIPLTSSIVECRYGCGNRT
jgi:hypothetical protein